MLRIWNVRYEYARTMSDCGSFARGGDLGSFERGQMQKTFEPLEYKFAKQETKPWDEVREMILRDVYVSILNSI